MNDTLLESEFQGFLRAAVDFVGSVPEFARRFNLDPSVVHKTLRGQFRPRPCLLTALKVEELRVYLLPDDAARWYERHANKRDEGDARMRSLEPR